MSAEVLRIHGHSRDGPAPATGARLVDQPALLPAHEVAYNASVDADKSLLSQPVSTKQAVGGLLVAAGIITGVVSHVEGWAGFVAWAMVLLGMILLSAATSAVVRLGGALIGSLVVLLVVAVVMRPEPTTETPAVARDDPYQEKRSPPPEPRHREASPPPVVRPEISTSGSVPTQQPTAAAVARQLALGDAEARVIQMVASRNKLDAQIVGDKAAKVAELCVGGEDEIVADPGRAVRIVAASLRFVEDVTRDPEVRDMLSLDDAFVTYVLEGCPT